MKRKRIIPYNPKLKERANHPRKNSTLSEVLLWKYLKGKKMSGYDFDVKKSMQGVLIVIKGWIRKHAANSSEPTPDPSQEVNICSWIRQKTGTLIHPTRHTRFLGKWINRELIHLFLQLP